MPTLDIETFHKGITDKYLNGDPSAARKMDNLLIDENGKLIQRPGINIYNSSAPQIPAGNQRIDSLYYFDTTLFAKSGTKLYFLKDGDVAWSTLAGPAYDAFADSEVGAKATWSEWRGHLFITPGPTTNIKTGCRTVKVYRNTSGNWALLQAGLPKAYKIETATAPSDVDGTPQTIWYSLFVHGYYAQIKGIDTFFVDYSAPTVFASTAGHAFNLAIGYKLNLANALNQNYPTTNVRVLTYRTLDNGIEAYVDDISALDTAVTCDTALDRNVSESKPTVAVSAQNFTAAGTLTVSTVDALNFFFVGREVQVEGPSGTRYYAIAVNYSSGLVTFSLTRGGAAATGVAYSLVSNSLRVILGETLYPGATDGIYNDPIPSCNFSAIIDNYGWYAGCQDTSSSGGMRSNRILQSKPGSVSAAPVGNFVDVPGDHITAFSSVGSHPVAFTRNGTFRIEGRYDVFGNGIVRAIQISDSEGSVSQDVIKTSDGIYFGSENGWCWTNGFDVTNLSKVHLKTTYSNLSTKTRMSGCYDTKNGLAYFGVESTALVSGITGKNNSAFVLNVKRTELPSGVFTTMSAGANLQPNSLHYDSANARVLIGDQRGYVFKLDDSLTTDPVVNTATAWSTWTKTAIVWDYITSAFAFGSTRVAKWMSDITAIAKNLTGNVSIDMWSYKDDRTTGVQIKAVRERSITSGLHKIFRRFPKGNLSCLYAQLQLKKGFVVIARSNDYALATLSGAANTALLASGTWPNDGSDSLVGHHLYPAIAGAYVTGWEIITHSGDTLTVADTGNTFPTASGNAWVVKGYPKNESLELHSLGIDHSLLGEGYPERSDQGGNA